MSAPNLQPARGVLAPHPLTQGLPKSVTLFDRWNRIPFRRKVMGTVVLTALLHPVIGDNWGSRANRAIPRLNNGQLIEMIFLLNHLSRPIHDNGFPNGDIELLFGDMEW